ncbi:sigma-70 family RNA polymerase sigma factor [Streptomyces sp. AJS327]|uniref:sigma-70 family RNA polymerase sigma factor n=1 Tax=Streptomyces sp. AJS327 TaxID=2545265 RepID=UPI0015DD5963|nr:sigma-70 family RNA polymerase sigma factor [Streptomyces sp. AJS327]MBA0053788.1 sigma-70 family RNA polymerase sigma factor [Streptomyces sp. AJS327]
MTAQKPSAENPSPQNPPPEKMTAQSRPPENAPRAQGAAEREGPPEREDAARVPGAGREQEVAPGSGAAEQPGDGVPEQRAGGSSSRRAKRGPGARRRATEEERSVDAVPSDAELVARMRRGEAGAYEELYRRHAEPVRRYARTCCRDAHTAEDLTNEVFARTLQAVQRGSGPESAVRAYLLTSVRRVAAAWSKSRKREHLVEDFVVFTQSAAAVGAGPVENTQEVAAEVRAMEEAEQSLVLRAFRSLTEEEQTLLWHTTVEGGKPREVAPLLGKTPEATATAAHRARESLKQAYLQAHVSRARTTGGDCARYAERLGAFARGGLRMRAERGLRAHLAQCAECSEAAVEVRSLNERIRVLVPLAVVGWFGTAGAEAFAALITGTGATLTGGAAASGTAAAAAAGTAAGGSTAGGGAGAAGGGAAAEGVGAPVKVSVAAGLVATAAGVALAMVLSGSGDKPNKPEAKSSSSAEVPSAPAAEPKPDPPAPRPEPSAPPAKPRPEPSKQRPTPSPKPTPTPPPPPSQDPPPSAPTPTPPPSAPSAPVLYYLHKLKWDVIGRQFPPDAMNSMADRVDQDAHERVRSAGNDSARVWTDRTDAHVSVNGPYSPINSSTYLGSFAGTVSSGPGGEERRRGARAETATWPVPDSPERPKVPTIRALGSGWLWQRDGGLRMGGERHANGVTVPARSSVTVDLNRSCSVYEARTGVDDLSPSGHSVRFSVYGDGRRLWRSGEVSRGERPLTVRVRLEGVRSVRLVVDPVRSHDHVALADWADARLSC